MTSLQLESTLVGISGEYFVAAELSLRGYLATITLRNSRGIDIIASTSDAKNSINIQVKSNKGGKPSWIVSKKSETFVSDKHYYVFVVLYAPGVRPDFHIVPSKVVSDYVTDRHRTWLAGTKKDGTARKDSNMRVFRDIEGIYKEAWDILDGAH